MPNENVANHRGLSLGASTALVWLCSIAPLGAILIPLLLPILEAPYGLSAGELGLLAAADLAGACLASLSAPFWLRRVGSRAGVLTGLLVVIAANGGAVFTQTATALLLVRFVAGIGMGLTLSSAIPLVAVSRRPVRLVSAVQLLQLLVASAALAGAGWLLSIGGVENVLFAVVACAALSIPVVLLLPPHSKADAQPFPTLAQIRPGLPVLLGILVYFASIAMLTNYAGKLGEQHGLTIAAISTALALGNLGALPGSLLAMAASDAHRRRWLVIGATLVQCGAIAAMLLVDGTMLFTAAFFVIQIAITALSPLQVAALVDEDSGGRAIEGLAVMQSFGQAIGPLLGSLFIIGARVDGVYLCGLACVVVSALLITRPRAALRPAPRP